MKQHSTNYTNTFIEVAEDCFTSKGTIPPSSGESKSIASMQFDLVSKQPYTLTSDDVFFKVFAMRNDLTKSELPEARKQFFSKGQPCFRASPLTKRYGWGVHSDQDGKIALYGCEIKEYARFSNDKSLKVIKAMKSKK